MTEAFKFFGGNSAAALIVALTFLLVGLCVIALCVVAFVQGRSITFWPPSIGERTVTLQKQRLRPRPHRLRQHQRVGFAVVIEWA